MICTVCESTITPSKMYQHICQLDHSSRKDYNPGQRLTFATREFCTSIVKQHNLKYPKHHQPKTIISVLPGLPIYNYLFCCKRCGYAVKTRRNSLEHQRGACKGHGFYSGPAQTFLLSSGQRYFAVTVHPVSILKVSIRNPLDPVALFEKQSSLDP